MEIAVIKYNAGNIGSVVNALARLGRECTVTDEPDEIRRADRVIFPGVGEAANTMKYLQEKGLDRLIPELVQPVLGICLGMQLLCHSTEEGNTPGLGIFSESVFRFGGAVKVPHMGWNRITFEPDALFRGLDQGIYVYFVHSYYAETGGNTLATCEYGLPFSAALRKGNFRAVQFHPEKSGPVGRQILNNFIEP